MTGGELYKQALRALKLSVEDAISHPNTKNAVEVKSIATHCLSELKRSTTLPPSTVNKIKSVMVLNRIVIRTVSKSPNSVMIRQNDLESLKRALGAASLKESDETALLEISSHFSEVARKYCIAEKVLLEPSTADPRLSDLVRLCNDQVDSLVLRSIAIEQHYQ